VKRFLSHIAVLFPLFFLTLLLLVLVAVKVLDGVLVPTWVAWIVGLGWAIMAMDYAIRFELFKQIGGLFIILLVLILLIGSLMPLQHIQAAPRLASDQLVEAFESTWNAVYQGKLFRDFSPKQIIGDTLRGFGQIDPFRGGRMFLLAAFGFSLPASLLFPYEPPKRRSLHSARVYWLRLAVLVFAAGIFAVHLELLQVLTRTRTVSMYNLVENLMGVWLGFVLFVPVQWGYALLAERRRHESSRFNVLGVGVDAVNLGDCCTTFEQIIVSDPSPMEPAMACALGVAGIVAARRNPKLQSILNHCVLNTPDGMPLVWLGKLYGYEQIERVYGPDLLRDICAYSQGKGWTHYFYGAAPGIVEKLKAELERRYPRIRIVGTKCPPFRPLEDDEELELIAEIDALKPDIFWIGISTPKQLYLMDHFRRKLNCKIICPVGYAFDVNAGVEVDAPDWIKYSGLQWLHRGIKQPRLWKRYLPDNPRFVFEIVLQLLRLRKYPMLGCEE
jgi:N-acetylglucosaminyldiphosphoundecaprenol N-acetyl-beta-D-mannosaminyltransferase